MALTLAALATVTRAVKVGDLSSPPPQKVAGSSLVTQRYLPQHILATLSTVGVEANDSYVDNNLLEPADPCKAGRSMY